MWFAGLCMRSTAGRRPVKSNRLSFWENFNNHIAEAGPQGWLDWMLALRICLFIGRRIEFGQYLPKTTALWGPDGRRLLRAYRVTHLPRDPLRSDVDVFVNSPQSLLLTEDATDTLQGLMASTRYLIDTVATDLSELWKWRRSHPEELHQPAAQWPSVQAEESIGFAGYRPGKVELSPSAAMTMNPIQVRRFRSAALDDESRPLWTSFD